MLHAPYCPPKLQGYVAAAGQNNTFSANDFCLLPLLLSELKTIKIGAANAIESVDKLWIRAANCFAFGYGICIT